MLKVQFVKSDGKWPDIASDECWPIKDAVKHDTVPKVISLVNRACGGYRHGKRYRIIEENKVLYTGLCK